MENSLKELLENEVLSEETKSAFLEAWNNKVDQVKASLREETEVKVREEFATRYNQDKDHLVEAMDNMLSDAVAKHAEESFKQSKSLKEERAKLTNAIKETRNAYKARVENHSKTLESFVLTELKTQMQTLAEDQRVINAQRVKLANEIREAKQFYKAKIQEHMGKLQNFVLTKMGKEFNQVRSQEQALAETRVVTTKKLREHRLQLTQQTAERINKLENFVVEQLSKEISEFKQDKDQLVEMRVKMATEARAKLDKTKKQFVERASKLVEKTIETHLRKELIQLKEDIQAARENMFGRRLFEAYQAEFMTSYLSEGTQVKKLSTQLQEVNGKLSEATAKLSNSQTLIEQAQRRVSISEENAVRVKTMNDLLRPLNKDKREVMENLLETVKTNKLQEAFRKYLPAVINETVRDVTANRTRQVIAEARPAEPARTIALTGNRVSRISESARSEDVQTQNAEIVELRRLAGIEK